MGSASVQQREPTTKRIARGCSKDLPLSADGAKKEGSEKQKHLNPSETERRRQPKKRRKKARREGVFPPEEEERKTRKGTATESQENLQKKREGRAVRAS